MTKSEKLLKLKESISLQHHSFRCLSYGSRNTDYRDYDWNTYTWGDWILWVLHQVLTWSLAPQHIRIPPVMLSSCILVNPLNQEGLKLVYALWMCKQEEPLLHDVLTKSRDRHHRDLVLLPDIHNIIPIPEKRYSYWISLNCCRRPIEILVGSICSFESTSTLKLFRLHEGCTKHTCKRCLCSTNLIDLTPACIAYDKCHHFLMLHVTYTTWILLCSVATGQLVLICFCVIYCLGV